MLSNKSKAIGYIMLSAFGFALMTAFVRMAGDLPQSGRGHGRGDRAQTRKMRL